MKTKITSQLSLLALCLFFGTSLSAQMYPPGSSEGMPAEVLFPVCGECHGAEGQGVPRADTPPLAGQQAWYIELQLKNFKAGIRGSHPEDLAGAQMDVISGMMRNEATIKNLAAYIETLPLEAGPALGPGGRPWPNEERPFIWESKYAAVTPPEPADLDRGREIYNGSCIACHGDKAQGVEMLGGNALWNLTPKYIGRQLKYFKDGVRGAHPEDIRGQQMAAMMTVIPDEQAIADVSAYIASIEL